MSLAFPETPPAALDAEGRVVGELPCGRCGYLLRGQLGAGDCPECGAAIGVTESPAALRPADESPAHAAWRARVERAPKLLGRGLMLLPLGFLPGLIALVLGVWAATGREPDVHEGRSRRITRLFARWFVVVAAPACFVALVWGAWMTLRRRGFGGDGWRMLDFAVSASFCTLAIGLMFAWRHLHDLAARAGHPDHATHLRRLWRKFFRAILIVAAAAAAVVVADTVAPIVDPKLPGPIKLTGIASFFGFAVTAAVFAWLGVSTLRLLRELRLGSG